MKYHDIRNIAQHYMAYIQSTYTTVNLLLLLRTCIRIYIMRKSYIYEQTPITKQHSITHTQLNLSLNSLCTYVHQCLVI